MRNRTRTLWTFLLLLCIGWTLFGLAGTSDLMQSTAAELTTEVRGLASGLGIDLASDFSLETFALVSGLPLSLLFALLLWRSSRQHKTGSATPTRRQILLVTLLALLLVFLLWNIALIEEPLETLAHQAGLADVQMDGLDMLFSPVRRFVTFIHEASHALAALITGGEVMSFTVWADGGGVASTRDGDRLLILSAGYLGTAFFGSLLFFLANRTPRWGNGLAIFIGAVLILLTLLYARPDQTAALDARLSASSDSIAFFVGIGFGLIFILIGWAAPRLITLLFLNTIAMMTALQAVQSLWYLAGNPGVGGGHNDAAAFAQESPLFPADWEGAASIVAIIWAAAAVLMLLAAINFGLVKPLRREISSTLHNERDSMQHPFAYEQH